MEYSYQIYSLKTTDSDALKDIVLEAYWDMVLKDGDYEVRYPSLCKFNVESLNTQNFIEYSALTSQKVTEWIESTLSEDAKENIRLILQDNMNQKKKNVKNPSLPWV